MIFEIIHTQLGLPLDALGSLSLNTIRPDHILSLDAGISDRGRKALASAVNCSVDYQSSLERFLEEPEGLRVCCEISLSPLVILLEKNKDPPGLDAG